MLKNYLPMYDKNKNINNYEEFNITIDKRENLHKIKTNVVVNDKLSPLKHQELISNMMRGVTPVDSLLVVHDLGTGKTCTSVNAIEKNFDDNMFGMKRAVILNRGKAVANNFINELVNKCTNKYRANNERAQKALWNKKYQFETFEIFAKKIKSMSDNAIINSYNNTFIVIDEVHNLLNEEALTYTEISRFLSLLPNKKVLLLSGTPVKDSPEDIVPILNLILAEKINQKTFKVEYYDSTGNLKPSFKNKILGKVSYLISPIPEIPIVNMGHHIFDLKKFKVVTHTMSKFQSDVYLKAFEYDKQSGGVYNNSRQSIRFVYPDGSFGAKGYSTWIVDKKYKFKHQMRTELTKYGNDRDSILKRIHELSAKYFYIINSVLEADERGEKTLIYDDLVKGSGLIVLFLLLDFIGFKKARLLTAETNTVTEISNIQKMFNEDTTGSKISVLLGSRVISEGFTFLDVLHEHIVPHWNNTETMQVLARGVRLGSHNKILNMRPDAKIKIYRYVTLPITDKTKSIDYIMTKASEEKDIEINKVLEALKEASLTCHQFITRNGGKCDSRIVPSYQKPDVSNVYYGYTKYSDDKINNTNKIINHFKDNKFEHINILSKILEIPLPLLLEHLTNLVYDKIPFVTNFGVKCYLNRSRNMIFRVDSITRECDPYSSNYTNYLKPFVNFGKQDMFNHAVEIFVDSLDSYQNIQRMVEIAISIEMTKMKVKNNDYKNSILAIYNDKYNIDYENMSAIVWVNYEKTKIYRCLKQPRTSEPWNEWVDCEDVDDTIPNLQSLKSQNLKEFEKTMSAKGFKHYGLWNPVLNEFCVKNIETESVGKIAESTNKQDKRKMVSGKRCVNWSKKELIEIAKVNSLPVDDWDTWSSNINRIEICEELYNWFSKNNALTENRSCGVQNKKK